MIQPNGFGVASGESRTTRTCRAAAVFTDDGPLNFASELRALIAKATNFIYRAEGGMDDDDVVIFSTVEVCITVSADLQCLLLQQHVSCLRAVCDWDLRPSLSWLAHRFSAILVGVRFATF